jgi:hypothetical protein
LYLTGQRKVLNGLPAGTELKKSEKTFARFKLLRDVILNFDVTYRKVRKIGNFE